MLFIVIWVSVAQHKNGKENWLAFPFVFFLTNLHRAGMNRGSRGNVALCHVRLGHVGLGHVGRGHDTSLLVEAAHLKDPTIAVGVNVTGGAATVHPGK